MKAIFLSFSSLSACGQSIVSLILRLTIGGAMLTHGLPKLLAFSNLHSDFPDPLHVGSTISLLLSIGAEVGCSILLIVGLCTRLATLPLIFTMLMAFFVIHSADPFSARELPLLYMIVYIAVFALGAGRFSLDYLIFKK